MDGRIKNWMVKNHVPGLAACVVYGDRVQWSGGYGFANLDKEVPFTPEKTLFQIASVTKTFTATTIMQLRERGLCDLDDDINRYLDFSIRNPKFPDDPITFRHLLTHTSSIRDPDSLYAPYAAGDPKISLRDAVTQHLAPGGKLWTRKTFRNKPPGANERYANLGFALLGYLVEVIGKAPLEDHLRQNIFVPLNMTETSFYIARLDGDRQAFPYTYAKSAKRKLCPGDGDGNLLPAGAAPKSGYNAHALYSYPTLADGMLRTSVVQLANFLIAMMNGGRFDGGHVLGPQSVKDMMPDEGPGLGWFRNKKYWGHDGSDPGCATEMWFNPISKFGFVIFANADVELTEIVQLLKTASTKQSDSAVS